MQLFITSPYYRTCAINLDDKRLNKQIIEGCQILSTAIWTENCDIAETLYAEGKIYLPMHEFHPLVIHSKYNYLETCKFIFECIVEWKHRFGKVHGCNKYLGCLMLHAGLFDKYTQKPFINSTTNHKHIENVYESYKKELTFKWNNDIPKFTNRAMPEWGIKCIKD
jgi:hypothetical protein